MDPTITFHSNDQTNGSLAFGKLRDYINELENKVKKLEQLQASGNVAAAAATTTNTTTTEEQTKKRKKTIVFKIGTASVVDKVTGIKLSQVSQLLETIASLKRLDHNVLLVTSGAVGTGAHQLKIFERPTTLTRKQALAAVGQVRLMRELNAMLSTLGVESAQVLLTYENLVEYTQSVNARLTIEELFALGVVPVVNENDTVATEELRYGDNDRLSAMVASLIEADLLFLLTDVNGLYTSNPNVDANAVRIPWVEDVEKMRSKVNTSSGAGSSFSTGGMESKLQAAAIATKSGVRTIVMQTRDVSRVVSFVSGFAKEPEKFLKENEFGTVFQETLNPIRGRKKWIYSLPPRGKLLIDSGATKAIKKKSTLFAIGVVELVGNFKALDAVKICSRDDPDVVLAVGLSNLDSTATKTVLGKKSEEIKKILKNENFEALIDRENLAYSHDLSDD